MDIEGGMTKNTDKRIRVNFTDSNGAESVETAAGGDIWFCLPECVPAVGDSVMCVRPYLVVDKTWHSPDQCTIHLGYNIYT